MKTKKNTMPKTGQNDLADKIRELRSKLGMTQEQFAAKVGVTFSTVSRWESGKSKPSPLPMRQIEELMERTSGRYGTVLLEGDMSP
jgi:transcriptional regulator with XRE-family HTH domain